MINKPTRVSKSNAIHCFTGIVIKLICHTTFQYFWYQKTNLGEYRKSGITKKW